MVNIAKNLRARYSRDELYLLLAKSNSGNFTYDGIERGGERVSAEIEQEIRDIEKKGTKIKKLSIIGYSLGGLVARYAVGMLNIKGVLDAVECQVRAPDGAREYLPWLIYLALELHDVRVTPPRRTKPAQRLVRPPVQRHRRKHSVQVGPPALHPRQVSRHQKALAGCHD